jgi:hypothetical protein
MSESETEDVQYKVTKEFRKNVLKWVDIDDSLRAIRAKVKELNDEKKKYEEEILSYLGKVEEDGVALKDGKLSKYVSKSKEPLNKDTIQKSLVECIGDSTKASQLTEHIINNRKITEKVKLSRTKTREKADKK